LPEMLLRLLPPAFPLRRSFRLRRIRNRIRKNFNLVFPFHLGQRQVRNAFFALFG
jgi:hypothetical protein